jgi:hypothetical protein
MRLSAICSRIRAIATRTSPKFSVLLVPLFSTRSIFSNIDSGMLILQVTFESYHQDSPETGEYFVRDDGLDVLRIFQEVVDCKTDNSSAGENPRQTVSKNRFHRVPFHLMIQIRPKQVDFRL